MEMVVKAKCLKSQITFHPGSYSSATVVKNGGKKEVTAKKRAINWHNETSDLIFSQQRVGAPSREYMLKRGFICSQLVLEELKDSRMQATLYYIIQQA